MAAIKSKRIIGIGTSTRVGTAVLAGTLCAGLASAAEIYRWTDADGVVHFSDRPPAAEQESLSTMEVDHPPPSGYDPNEDRYNVAATAERTQALRDAQAQARESRQQQNAAAAPVVQQAQPQAYAVDDGYWPGYDRPGVRPPLRPDRPVRPEPQPPPTDTVRPVRRSRN